MRVDSETRWKVRIIRCEGEECERTKRSPRAGCGSGVTPESWV